MPDATADPGGAVAGAEVIGEEAREDLTTISISSNTRAATIPQTTSINRVTTSRSRATTIGTTSRVVIAATTIPGAAAGGAGVTRYSVTDNLPNIYLKVYRLYTFMPPLLPPIMGRRVVEMLSYLTFFSTVFF